MPGMAPRDARLGLMTVRTGVIQRPMGRSGSPLQAQRPPGHVLAVAEQGAGAGLPFRSSLEQACGKPVVQCACEESGGCECVHRRVYACTCV